MQKPVYDPQDEQNLMAHLWSPMLANDPEAFVLFVFPWGQPNTPLERFSGPREWQRSVLRDLAQHIRDNNAPDAVLRALREAIASGRGIGKSALVSWLILWMLSTKIGSSVIVSANSEPQLRKVTWGELTKWTAMSINSHWWQINATNIVPAQWIATLVERDLKKGTRYWGAEGKLWSEENPDAYAGVHNHDGMMVIFDEASGIPDGIWSVASGFFTEPIVHRYWFAFSNPRRPTGYFYECFHAKRDFWTTRQIDARTVEGTDRSIYDQIIEEHGEDSFQARVEVYGEFPIVGDDQFIGPQMVRDAVKRARYNDPSAPVVVGIDPARHGSDSTVIVVRQGRDLVEIRRYRGDDTMTVVGHVIEAIEEFKPTLTVMDEGGLGYGILDRLVEQRYKVRGVNFGQKAKNSIMWGNKRAEMWGAMREWLKTASVPDDRQLKADLIAPRTKPDSAGTMFLESKKDMKARGLSSPDAADALAVTFAFPVAHRQAVLKPERRTHYQAVNSSWMSA